MATIDLPDVNVWIALNALDHVHRARAECLRLRHLRCNSDQGSHFTSSQYIERLLAKEIRISITRKRVPGKGRALDNIFTERLWRSVKYEEVYLNEYDSPRAARQGLSRYLHFYNEESLHQSLDYKTPVAVYEAI